MKRPEIDIKRERTDKVIDTMTLVIVAAMWVCHYLFYKKLPEIIPVHYNIAGENDGYGAKSSILTLPFFATVIFVFLYLLHSVPHMYNYTKRITVENALHEYTKATKLIRYINLVAVITLATIFFVTLQKSL